MYVISPIHFSLTVVVLKSLFRTFSRSNILSLLGVGLNFLTTIDQILASLINRWTRFKLTLKPFLLRILWILGAP